MCRLYVLSAAYRYYIRDPAITTHLRIHMSDTHIRDTQQDTYIRILPHCEIHISDTHIRDTHNRILTFRFFRDTHIRDTHNRILAFGFFRTVEYIWVIPTSAIHTTRYLHLDSTCEWYTQFFSFHEFLLLLLMTCTHASCFLFLRNIVPYKHTSFHEILFAGHNEKNRRTCYDVTCDIVTVKSLTLFRWDVVCCCTQQSGRVQRESRSTRWEKHLAHIFSSRDNVICR